MKRSLFALIFVLVVGVRAQEPASSPASPELLQLEKTRVNALVHDDIPALEKLFADDLTYVHSSGVLESKAEFLGRLRSGERKYLSKEHEPGVALRSYGDTTILTGSTKVAVTFRGQSQNLHLRFTETWHKRAGQWQVVA
jgi:ketosteroid isomerase-like protein